MSGFGDQLPPVSVAVSIRLECGHPNVGIGENCSLCGRKVVAIENGIHITEE